MPGSIITLNGHTDGRTHGHTDFLDAEAQLKLRIATCLNALVSASEFYYILKILKAFQTSKYFKKLQKTVKKLLTFILTFLFGYFAEISGRPDPCRPF